MSIDHLELRRLPSLRALLAFVAAGETGNFSRAAQALYLTQGAISRHILALEKELGVSLFSRHGRRVSITPSGQQYLRSVEGAFEALYIATRSLAIKTPVSNRVAVTTTPSFAVKWLSPRLGRFYSAMPDIELQVHTSRALMDLDAGEHDLAIRYGSGRWIGVNARRLLQEEIFPVCSPALLNKWRWPNLLRKVPLLHGDIPESWSHWLRRAGLRSPPLDKGPRFNEDLALLQSAAEGHGVALGRSALVERDLAAGVLAAPAVLRLRARYSYWIVTPPSEASPAAARFIEWLLQEAAVAL